MITDKVVRRFTRVRIQLMQHKKFIELGPVMMMGKRTLTTAVRTACTDGRDEWYNPDFVFQWSDKEAGFIIMHENFHKGGRHLDIYQVLHRINPLVTNLACDHWINLRLVDADPNNEIIAMPRDADGKPIGCLNTKYRGWSIKQIFDDLIAKAKESEDEEEGESEGEGKGKGKGNTGAGLDDHDWEGAKGMTEEEKRELKQDIEQALRDGQLAAKRAGVGGGNSPLGIDELLKPQVDWKKELADFVRSTCKKKEESTWRRLSRRYLANGIVMPTLAGKSIKELVVAPDVSGSMFCEKDGSTPFKVCMSEIEGLAKQLQVDKLHLIYWDGWVTRHEEYTATTMGDWRGKTKPSGGGGTDPSCLPVYLKEKGIKPDATIVLTDGEVNRWGTWSCPVLWCICNTNAITAPVGKTIRVD